MAFDYNTSRKKLVLPEYGRNLQMMVDYMMTLEDREERTSAAYTIIGIMGNLNPQLKEMTDVKHKLWDHLAMMTDFKLDIDAPFEMPEANILKKRPNIVEYNSNHIRFKHYGKNVEKFVDKAIDMEDGEVKRAFIEMIANHMKKLYLTHNRENVSDEQILRDLSEISEGRLIIPGDIRLQETKDILQKNNKKRKNTNNNQQSRKRDKRHN